MSSFMGAGSVNKFIGMAGSSGVGKALVRRERRRREVCVEEHYRVKFVLNDILEFFEFLG